MLHPTEAPWGQAGLISKEDIIIDAKSGVSGAGRSAKQNLLYTEIAEGLNCYGVTRHRHMPEIEQVGFKVEASRDLGRPKDHNKHLGYQIHWTDALCAAHKLLDREA